MINVLWLAPLSLAVICLMVWVYFLYDEITWHKRRGDTFKDRLATYVAKEHHDHVEARKGRAKWVN